MYFETGSHYVTQAGLKLIEVSDSAGIKAPHADNFKIFTSFGEFYMNNLFITFMPLLLLLQLLPTPNPSRDPTSII